MQNIVLVVNEEQFKNCKGHLSGRSNVSRSTVLNLDVETAISLKGSYVQKYSIGGYRQPRATSLVLENCQPV